MLLEMRWLFLLGFISILTISYKGCICQEFVDQNQDEYGSVTDEEEEESHELGQTETSESLDGKDSDVLARNLSELISYSVLFPDHEDDKLPAGVPIRLIVTFLHDSESTVVLRHMMAGLHHHKTASHSIQNFSTTEYDINIPPGIEYTVQYNFWPHHSFAERPFKLIMEALLTDEKEDYRMTVYNVSVVFKDLNTSNFDIQLVSIIVMILSMILGLGYFLYSKYLKDKFSLNKKVQVTKVETGTNEDGVDYGWLPRECLSDQDVKSNNKKKVA
ncbi:Translocon-associated protein subunit alpha [Thelohanellus kitauei]|uniref:Translocon-associated protein subunit alpha n=1 Tax=Thelohanellus kitauei TaxID=669202 RepID=A0A0C2NHM6_THEKT|nr:Translocon-associated protein subunit alpha [Thelohanellus kitauei]